MALDLWFAATEPPPAFAFEDLPKLWSAVLFALGATRESFRALTRAE
jgi:hypothetical protein